MLSVVRKENPLAMTNTDDTPPSGGGFSKMLNSLQGLQERLEDFSIADIANAEGNAQTLLLHLKQVQNIIAAIALLKKAEANISESSLAQITDADTESVGFDSLEKHPQLHAIIQASKLIKLHKMLSALKAASDNRTSQQGKPAAEPYAKRTLEQSSNLSESSDPVRLQTVQLEIASSPEFVSEVTSFAATLESVLPNPATTVSVFPTEVAIPGVTPSAIYPVKIDASTEFPTADAEFETANTSKEKTQYQPDQSLPEDFPAATNQSIRGEIIPSETSERATNLAKPAKSKQVAQITRIKKSTASNKEPRDESKAVAPGGGSFDLRLLDDLVSNYGEFASSPNLPATISNKELQAFDPATIYTPEVQPEQFSPVDLPMAKKNGDLDRQLKKIIKDYGEYDLYSGKQPTNLKKAGILAFVFLGLVFGGIYLFKAPPSTAKIAPASASSSTTPDERKLRASEEQTNVDGRDVPLGTVQKESQTKAKNK